MSNRSRGRQGFILVELLAAAGVLALLLTLVMVAGSEARRRSAAAASEESLHRFAGATTSFAGDHDGLYWAFSWKAGDSFSEWPDLNNAPTDMVAHANQAVDIIRRRNDPNFKRIENWIPDVFYSHLVLADYLDESLPMPLAASLADTQLRGWQDDKASAPNERLPFSSSYEISTSFYDKSEVNHRISSGGTHNTYFVPGTVELGARGAADVAFPSQKVHMYDRYQRHFGERLAFLGYKEARLPLLFCDGSVSVRMTGDGNPGWQPNSPNNPQATYYLYQPMAWEPPTMSGQQSEQVTGYLRWTRNGIAGRDYGGPEIGP
jgi:type II secretory pathway pseudopilin PulG